MDLTLFRRARNCAKVVEDLAASGKRFHMWAIRMYKWELCMTRLLNGGCITFKSLPHEMYIIKRSVNYNALKIIFPIQWGFKHLKIRQVSDFRGNLDTQNRSSAV